MMHYFTASKGGFLLFLDIVLTLAVLSGCAGVRLISDYDETTDKSLMAIQHRADDFIELLKKKAKTDLA
jgi:hypothetical protein